VLTNADLEKMVETSDEWIVSRTGIKERRIAEPEQACSDLAYNAARSALEDAGVKPEELDAIVVGTVTGDMQFPSTACLVQSRLGASNASAFDVSAACSGFVYAVNTVHAMIAGGQLKKALVIGVDLLTKFVDWEERSTCVLFGDAAGAIVLEECEAGEGILGTYTGSDGNLAELLYIKSGGSRRPVSRETVEEREHYIRMKGDGVFKYAVRAMEDAANRVLDAAGLVLSDVDLLIPHQANIRIIDAVARRMELPDERVMVNIDRYGNTSSGTIPVALDEAIRSGRVKKGNVVLMVTFGGGLTWGSVLLRLT